MSARDVVFDKLRDHGNLVRETGQDKAMAQCPAHDDTNPSLSIGPRRDGKGVVIYCQAGCDTAAVLAELGLTMADMFDDDGLRDALKPNATYTYAGGHWNKRIATSNGGKTFRQKPGSKDKSLFGVEHIGDATTVYVCEGEKGALAVRAVGGVAVATGGATRTCDLDPLAGRDVILIADRDDAGHKWADKLSKALQGQVKSITVVASAVEAEKADVVDHIAAGYTLDELVPVDAPSPLDGMVDGAWLDAQVFPPLEYAVPGIIPEGFGLLVAPPKKGKSWLVADIGLAVAAGGKALGILKVVKRPVLYLALEDGHRRLQSRFRRLLRDEAIPPGIHVIVKARPDEAMAAIRGFLALHADARPLIILDTLGKVKPPKRSGEDSYLVDYAIGSALKDAVDAVPGSTLLVVHHTRKAESADFVDSVSGTQGIAGSADFVMMLARKRHSEAAVLSVTGRDVPEAEYALKADDGMLWRLDGDDLEAASEAVDKRKASEKLSDRMMDVYRAVVEAAGQLVTAVGIAGALDMTNDVAGQYLRRLADGGYITKRGRGKYAYELSESSEPKQNSRSGQANDSDTDSEPLYEVSESDSAFQLDILSDTSDTSDTVTEQRCTLCGKPMLASASIAREYCEPCHLAAKRAAS